MAVEISRRTRYRKVLANTCELNPADQFVPSDVVEVHHHHVQGALPDFLPGHVEGEYLVEYRIQSAFEDWSFALLDPLVAELQPHLDVRICKLQVSRYEPSP